MIYVVKKDTWFDAGTRAKLIADCRPQINSGVFEGIKDGKLDEELCEFEEFEEMIE